MEINKADSELSKIASESVETIVKNSLENVEKCVNGVDFPLTTLKCSCLPEKETINFTSIPNIVWPTVAKFTPENGEEIVTFYIKNCWKYSKHWSFVVLLKDVFENGFIRYCVYHSIWSVPTRRAPIPAATATVYFIISYYLNKPNTEVVTVEFIVESSKIKHTPGLSRFDEMWIQQIIEMKMQLIKSLFISRDAIDSWQVYS